MTMADEDVERLFAQLQKQSAEWQRLAIDDQTRRWLSDSLNHLPETSAELRALAVERYERARAAGAPEKWLEVIERENEMPVMSADALDRIERLS